MERGADAHVKCKRENCSMPTSSGDEGQLAGDRPSRLFPKKEKGRGNPRLLPSGDGHSSGGALGQSEGSGDQ